MALKQAKKIVIDLGLVIECKEAELLPERLLCAWRICRPDLTQTVNIDWVVCLTENGDVLNRGKGLIGKEVECVFKELIGVGCKGLFRWRMSLMNRIDLKNE